MTDHDGWNPQPKMGTPEQARLTDAAARAIRLRRDAVSIFRTLVANAKDDQFRPIDPRVPVQFHDRAMQWRKVQITSRSFADSLMLYMKVQRSDEHVLPMGGLHTMMASCASLMIILLAKGHEDYRETLPIRGGMALDVGTEVADRESSPGGEKPFYSAGTAEAYHLESECADSPRVLVSETVQTLIESRIHTPPGDLEDLAEQNIARSCQGFLFTDVDDRLALDFLGESTRKLHMAERTLVPLISQGWQFVQIALAAHRAAGDKKLVAKYEALEAYFRSRVGLWGFEP